MYFQIRKIILWPNSASLRPRELDFVLGKVNVLHGESSTGKSSIISIIDYCLGSKHCEIPQKTIREKCSWYGIIFQQRNSQFLFARKDPGVQLSSSEMYVKEDLNINVPLLPPEPNISERQARRRLDELAHLPSLEIDENRAFHDRPSFRDMVKFCIQPQDIVANKRTLFYDADIPEHQQKLKAIIPFAIGAVPTEYLEQNSEYKRLTLEFKRKKREFDSAKVVSDKWKSDVLGKLFRAKELGLIEKDIPTGAEYEQLVGIFKELLKSARIDVMLKLGNITDAVQTLIDLTEKEYSLDIKLTSLQKRYREMKRLREISGQYGGSIVEQKERLSVTGILLRKIDHAKRCPACGSEQVKTLGALEEMKAALERVEDIETKVEHVPSAFDKEFLLVQGEIEKIAEQINAVRVKREQLSSSSEEAKQYHYNYLQAARFLGNIEEAIKIHERVGKGGDLSQEIAALQENINRVEGKLKAIDVSGRLKTANDNLSRLATIYIQSLETQYCNYTIHLSEETLSIKVRNGSTEEYLAQVGGASNHIALHVATILGMQQFFIANKKSPVPSFAIFDQPSQAWFPQGYEKYDDGTKILEDRDRAALAKVFQTMNKAIEDAKGALQIILIDHAGEKEWGVLSHFQEVEKWRGGKKLIPTDWL